MAVYTKLEFEEVKNLIRQYDIGELKAFRGIEEGVENSNYFIQAESGDYILTIYEKRVRESDLPFFLGLTEHLGEKGIPCPAPVHDRDGNILQDIKGKKGALVTFLQGKSIREITPEHCHEVGEMLAKMHGAGNGFALSRNNSMGKGTWRGLFFRIAGRISELPGMDKVLIENVLDRLDKNWPLMLPSGIIHADLFPDNVFFTPSLTLPRLRGREGWGLTGVIDFYFACNDFLILDFAICLNSWCFDKGWILDKQKARALFEGYNGVRKITAEELDKLPLLCLGAALRFLLTRSYDWLNPAHGALVKKLDPLEYWAKLKFHEEVKSYEEYGF